MDKHAQSDTRRLRVSNEFAGQGHVTLLFGDADLTRLALYGVTRAATDQHSVWVLDGANSFDAYFIARLARRWNYAPEPILARIKLSRAFTCYQISELITQRLAIALGSPMGTAIFCLGLLDTFYDEKAVPLVDAVRMVKMISATLTTLAQHGYTVLITAREPREEQKERRVLLDLLKVSAQHVEYIRAPSDSRKTFVQQPLLLAG